MRPKAFALIVLVVCGQFVLGGGALAQAQLELGYYVDPDVPCGAASNVDVSLVHWSGINAARTVCEFTKVEPIGPDLYAFSQTCQDISTTEAQRVDGQILISGATGFELRVGAGVFPYRYCAQADMPEPWRSNDLTDYQR